MKYQNHYYMRMHVSNACNQRCSYCHVFSLKQPNNPPFMSFNTAQKALVGFIKIRPSDYSHLTISLYGGEPLLNWKMLKKLFRYGNSLKEKGAFVEWVLNTNATLITEKIANTLFHYNVDVHMSLDGSDIKSNAHRVLKNNKPSFNRTIRGLNLLRDAGCRLQFDTCLTKANIYRLEELVDLASSNGVDRIYAALTDNIVFQSIDTLKIDNASEKVSQVIPYALAKGVEFGGPWKRAIAGKLDYKSGSTDCPNFQVNTNGQVFISPFMNFPLGDIDELDRIYTKEKWKKIKSEWNISNQKECINCTLWENCQGYLKGMFLYHTGKENGYSRECQFTLGVLNNLSGFPTQINPNDWNGKLIVSKHLKLKSTFEGDYIVHGLNGTAISKTTELMNILTDCSEKRVVSSLWCRYSNRTDIRYAIYRLAELKFLVNPVFDEENQWLDKRIKNKNFRDFTTEHFIFRTPEKYITLVHHFASIMEKAWSTLSSEKLPEPEFTILVIFLDSRNQFHSFWGNQELPDWPKAFVTAGRIIIFDAKKLKQSNIDSLSFLQGMIHEIIHIWLFWLGCHIPVWMEEGLCEYYSQPFDEEAFLRVATQKHIFGFREMEALVKHNLLDLDQSNIRKNICYLQSHGFIKFLIKKCGESEFIDYLGSVILGDDHRIKFNKFFGISLDDYEKEWIEKLPPKINKHQLRPSKHLQIIKRKKKVLLYNSMLGGNIVTNYDTLQFFDYFKDGASLADVMQKVEIEDETTIIRELFYRRLLDFGDDDCSVPLPRSRQRENIDRGSLINKLRLNVSTMCNLSCSYCYLPQLPGTPSKMSWRIAKKSIDSFMSLLFKNNHDHATLRFFGGEPMLNWKVIKESIEYADSLKGNIDFQYLLNTNGTIASKDIASFLSKKNVVVIVSVDGDGEVHDALRPFRQGTGSFSTVDSSLRLMLSAGCEIGLETTLSKSNCSNLKEIIDYVVRLKMETQGQISLGFQKVCMVKDEFSLSKIEQLLSNKLIDAIQYAWKKGIDVDDGMINIPYNALIGKRRKGIYCGGHGDELCVYPNGDIYPCGANPIQLGSINDLSTVFQSSAYKKLVNRYAGKIPYCNNCEIEAFCSGGCVADAVVNNGVISSQSGHCQMEKNIFNFLVKEKLLGSA